MDSDLGHLVHDRGTVLGPGDVKTYIKALLSALAACHGAGVLHRDVKPDNVLLGRDGRVVLADFGLASTAGWSPGAGAWLRAAAEREAAADRGGERGGGGGAAARPHPPPSASTPPLPARPLTNQVCSAWYRPPELLYGATLYGPAVDVWAAGCVFAGVRGGGRRREGEREGEREGRGGDSARPPLSPRLSSPPAPLACLSLFPFRAPPAQALATWDVRPGPAGPHLCGPGHARAWRVARRGVTARLCRVRAPPPPALSSGLPSRHGRGRPRPAGPPVRAGPGRPPDRGGGAAAPLLHGRRARDVSGDGHGNGGGTMIGLGRDGEERGPLFLTRSLCPPPLLPPSHARTHTAPPPTCPPRPVGTTTRWPRPPRVRARRPRPRRPRRPRQSWPGAARRREEAPPPPPPPPPLPRPRQRPGRPGRRARPRRRARRG